MKFKTNPLDLVKSETKSRILKFLLTHKATMSEREIASILNVSHMTINRIMRELADINLVNYISAGKAHLWQVNRKSYMFKTISRLLDNISNITEPIKALEKTILKNIPKKIIKNIILFGSISTGKERPDSDIDIFILVKNTADKKKVESHIDNLSSLCLDMFGNRLSPYILTEKELTQKKNSNIIDEVKKGIQIYPGKE